MAPDAPPLHDRLAGLRCLAGRRWRVSDLPGGLTNHNVRVTTTDDGEPLDVVVRCSQGEPALLGIDRDVEATNTARAAEAGVGAPLVEHRPDLDVLVIGYVEARTLGDHDFADPAVLARAARAVRRLHDGPAFAGVFDMVERQRRYRSTVAERGFALPAAYDDHADAFADVGRALAARPVPLVPCNNDLLAANYLDDGAAVHLIDYEYSGQNEAAFELGNTATECGFDDDRVEAWVEAYHGDPSAADLARVRLQMLCSEYGWALWGYIQAATSTLDFDFRGWGDERFEKAVATFRGPRLAGLLDAVVR